jgi:hypothetical protein
MTMTSLKVKSLNFLAQLILKFMAKESIIMKVTFAETSTVKEIEMSAEDIGALGAQMLNLCKMATADPTTAAGLDKVLASLIAVFSK